MVSLELIDLFAGPFAPALECTVLPLESSSILLTRCEFFFFNLIEGTILFTPFESSRQCTSRSKPSPVLPLLPTDRRTPLENG